MNISDNDLVLYADNRLSDRRKNELLEAVKGDNALAQTLVALDASRLPFKAASNGQSIPPVPEKLQLDVQNLVKAANRQNVTELDPARKQSAKARGLQGWTSPVAQAACLLLCIGVGFLIGTRQESTVSANLPELAVNSETQTGVEQSKEQREWVERVADYQTLYVANTVNKIVPDLSAAQDKLNEMAHSTGIRTAIPDLSDAGYQFTRVQELGYNGKVLVQLVYSKDGNTPLALCFMPADGSADESLHIVERHGLGTASWVEGNQRFVIVGNEAPDTLESLHNLTISSFSNS